MSYPNISSTPTPPPSDPRPPAPPEVRLQPGDRFRLGNKICVMRTVGVTGGTAWCPELGEFSHSNHIDKAALLPSTS